MEIKRSEMCSNFRDKGLIQLGAFCVSQGMDSLLGFLAIDLRRVISGLYASMCYLLCMWPFSCAVRSDAHCKKV